MHAEPISDACLLAYKDFNAIIQNILQSDLEVMKKKKKPSICCTVMPGLQNWQAQCLV
jgi:hypothetical protein